MNASSKRTNRSLPFQYLANATLVAGRSNRKSGVPVHFTLRFGEDRFVLKRLGVTLVDVTIGIRASYINFELDNCSMPEAEWAINPTAPQSLSTERVIVVTNTTAQEKAKGSKSTLDPLGATDTTILPLIKSSFESQRSQKHENRSVVETRTSFNKELFSISARGTASYPSWHIRALPDEDMLVGTLVDNARCVVAQPDGPKAQVRAMLVVPSHGYVLRRSDGSTTNRPNRWGITKLLIKKHLLSRPHLLAALDLQPPSLG